MTICLDFRSTSELDLHWRTYAIVRTDDLRSLCCRRAGSSIVYLLLAGESTIHIDSHIATHYNLKDPLKWRERVSE